MHESNLLTIATLTAALLMHLFSHLLCVFHRLHLAMCLLVCYYVAWYAQPVVPAGYNSTCRLIMHATRAPTAAGCMPASWGCVHARLWRVFVTTGTC